MGVPQNSLRSLAFAPFRHAAASQSTKRACGAPPIVLRPGPEARSFARHKQSKGLFVSGLSPSATHKSPPPGTACRDAQTFAC